MIAKAKIQISSLTQSTEVNALWHSECVLYVALYTHTQVYTHTVRLEQHVVHPESSARLMVARILLAWWYRRRCGGKGIELCSHTRVSFITVIWCINLLNSNQSLQNTHIVTKPWIKTGNEESNERFPLSYPVFLRVFRLFLFLYSPVFVFPAWWNRCCE